MEPIKKRFPANTTLEIPTFLNGKKVDGELYAYLQSISIHDEGITYVLKKNMPTQEKICKIIKVKSPKTLRTHMQDLKDRKLIVDEEDRYILPPQEDIYFLIPLKTLRFLMDNCKDHVMKIYVYLGQRWKWSQVRKEPYNFTYRELAKHTGATGRNEDLINQKIKNALELLVITELIDYEEIYIEKVPYKRLTNFSFEYKTINKTYTPNKASQKEKGLTEKDFISSSEFVF